MNNKHMSKIMVIKRYICFMGQEFQNIPIKNVCKFSFMQNCHNKTDDMYSW